MITTNDCKKELNLRVSSKSWVLIKKYDCIYEENCKSCTVREFYSRDFPDTKAFVFTIDNEIRKIDVVKEKNVPDYFDNKVDFLENVRTRPYIRRAGRRVALGFDNVKVESIADNMITIWHGGLDQKGQYVSYRYYNNGRLYAIF